MPSTVPMAWILVRVADWIQKGMAILEEDEERADVYFACAEDALRDIASGFESPSRPAVAMMKRIAELRKREGREELVIFG